MVLRMTRWQVVLLLTAMAASFVATRLTLVLLLLLLVMLLLLLLLPWLLYVLHALLQLLHQPPLLFSPLRVTLLLQLIQLLPCCCCQLV
jgi:hypothetical protein